MSLYKVFLSNLLAPVLTLNASNSLGIVTDSLLEIKPSIGIPFVLFALLGIYLFFKKSLAEKNLHQILLILLILFFMCFMLVWFPFHTGWIWPFTLLQYSWRLLSQIMWIGSLLFALGIYWLFSHGFNKKIFSLVLLLLIAMSAIWAPFFDVTYKTHGKLSELQHFSSDNYLLDAKKNPKIMNGIENFRLFYRKNKIPNDPPVIDLPANLLNVTVNPVIHVAGNMIDNKKNNTAHFIARFNGEKIAEISIKKGQFYWLFPLKKSLKNQTSNLQISIEPESDRKNFTFQIDKTYLSGFFDPEKVLAISDTKVFCRNLNSETVCQLKVPPKVNLLELPVFYYPNMLNIMLNGKSVPYISVLYNDALITAIQPEAGKENEIEVKFTGLLWANFVSSLAWGMFLLIAFYSILKRIFYKASLRGVLFTTKQSRK